MLFKDRSFSPLKYPTIVALALLLLIRTIGAQPPKPVKDQNFTPGTDVSLGLMGQTTFARNPTKFTAFPEWTTFSQQSQAASPSARALATFTVPSSPTLATTSILVIPGLRRPTPRDRGTCRTRHQSAPGGGGSFTAGSLDTHMYELTLAYAFYGPRFKRFRTFGQIGGGGLFLSR